jgi:hypothetical protein
MPLRPTEALTESQPLMIATRCLYRSARASALASSCPPPHDVEAALGARAALLSMEASGAWYVGNLVVCFRDDAPRSLIDRFASYWADLAR